MKSTGKLLLHTIILLVIIYLCLPKVLTWKFGEEVEAVVTELPEKCNDRDLKNRRITPSLSVVYENHSYSIGISSEDCEQGTYAIGDVMTLKYFSLLNHLQSTDPEDGVITAVFLFAVAGFYFYRVIMYYSKKEENQV